MYMDSLEVNKRNRQNVLSRWRKAHERDLNWMRSRKNVDFLKARICGYLAGDGNISIRKEKGSSRLHHEIRFYPDHESMIGPYITAFKKVFNKTPSVTKKANFFYVRINSKVAVNDLLSLCSFGSNDWTLPKFSDERCKVEWLRAMFNSDSYVSPSSIRLKVVNKNGLESVKSLLSELGIETSKIYTYKPKSEKWSVNYILDIRKKDSITLYFKKIGFNHKLKKEKLLKLVNGF